MRLASPLNTNKIMAMKTWCLWVSIVAFYCSGAFAQNAYKNESLPATTRATDLLHRLTLEEKVMLLGYRNQAIPRLHIPAYNWWSEGLHGVARAGEATIFPQAIGMAASFNEQLMQQVGNVISTEARAKHNLASHKGNRGMYVGLTYWSPNINIFRDPRWGRGQETYGEDPYLTSVMGIAYVKGMQGTDSNHLKIAAAAKHFVAHSGPENKRDYFNAEVSDFDLNNTYLYAFKKLTLNGVAGIMTAYNEVNGVPNSVNIGLLKNLIRNKWGFKGYIVTDCGALDDVYSTHKYLKDGPAAAAAAIKAGINLDCSSVLQSDITAAIDRKLITDADVDSALLPLLTTQVKLGFYDNPLKSKYRTFKGDSIHTRKHIALARKMAQQSMVLLKNSLNVLPLHRDTLKSIMVVGPNAASIDALVGSYHGTGSKLVNFVEGITAAVSKGTRVEYDLGCGETDTTHFGGIWAAGNADVTVAVLGLSPVNEGEAGDAFLSNSGGDRTSLSLPASQIAFLKALRVAVNKPIIVVLTGGSAINIDEIEPYADAIIMAWYPGEQGGNALADILFGKVSPSGHLPVTFYKTLKDVPAFDNYTMKDRTYRYYEHEVAYGFGYGLSYTQFMYGGLKVTANDKFIVATYDVTNIGKMAADDVEQIYIRYGPGIGFPNRELKGINRITLKPGESKHVVYKIPTEELAKWDANTKTMRVFPGSYELFVGKDAYGILVRSKFGVE